MPDTERVVFVVDDEVVIAHTLATILSQAGFRASAFGHAELASAECAEQTPHLLITDVAMPGMTGIELAIHFRRTLPECKVCSSRGRHRPQICSKRRARRDMTSICLPNQSTQPIFWQNYESNFRRSYEVAIGRKTRTEVP